MGKKSAGELPNFPVTTKGQSRYKTNSRIVKVVTKTKTPQENSTTAQIGGQAIQGVRRRTNIM